MINIWPGSEVTGVQAEDFGASGGSRGGLDDDDDGDSDDDDDDNGDSDDLHLPRNGVLSPPA